MWLTKIIDIGYALIPAEYVLPLEKETISEIITKQNENGDADQCREPEEKIQERYNEMRTLGW